MIDTQVYLLDVILFLIWAVCSYKLLKLFAKDPNEFPRKHMAKEDNKVSLWALCFFYYFTAMVSFYYLLVL